MDSVIYIYIHNLNTINRVKINKYGLVAFVQTLLKKYLKCVYYNNNRKVKNITRPGLRAILLMLTLFILFQFQKRISRKVSKVLFSRMCPSVYTLNVVLSYLLK